MKCTILINKRLFLMFFITGSVVRRFAYLPRAEAHDRHLDAVAERDRGHCRVEKLKQNDDYTRRYAQKSAM